MFGHKTEMFHVKHFRPKPPLSAMFHVKHFRLKSSLSAMFHVKHLCEHPPKRETFHVEHSFLPAGPYDLLASTKEQPMFHVEHLVPAWALLYSPAKP